MSAFSPRSRLAVRWLLASLLVVLASCLVPTSTDATHSAADAASVEPDGHDVPCTLNAWEPCYTGSPGTESVGACRTGSRVCRSEGWSDCYDVSPTVEVCNQVDDDCNGTRDDDMQDACGRCEPAPGVAARCIGKDCLRAWPSTLGLPCTDACCDCVALAPGQPSVSFREIFFLCDQEGLCAEGRESDRGWDQFIVDAKLLSGATVAMRFRAAAAQADLPSAVWHDASVDSNEILSFRFVHSDAFSEYVEVEVTLSSGGGPGLELCQLLAIPIQYI